MNIDTMRYIIALDQCKSFSKAADSVFISRQGFGKAIKALEDELGATLVTRSNEGVALTEQGEIVLRAAKEIVASYGKMVSEMRLSPLEEEAPKPRITSTPYIMQISAEAQIHLGTLAEAYLDELPFSTMLDEIERGSQLVYACELLPGSAGRIDPRVIQFEPFAHAVVGVIWSGECPLDNPASASPAEVLGLPLAVNSTKSLSKLYEAIFQGEEPRDVRFRTSNWQSLARAVESQGFVGMFDTYALGTMRIAGGSCPDVGFAPIASPHASFDLGFLYRKDAVLAPEYRQYINRAKLLF